VRKFKGFLSKIFKRCALGFNGIPSRISSFLAFVGGWGQKVVLVALVGPVTFVLKLSKLLGRISSFRFFAGGRRLRVGMLVLLVTFASTLLLFSSILGHLTYRSTIGSEGVVKTFGVGVYWDSGCSNPVSSVDWGLVEPGSAYNVTIYVRNEGNYAATLFLGAENWNPEDASNCLTLTWDYDNDMIDPSETVRITLTLLTSPGMGEITSFSFDIVISGVG